MRAVAKARVGFGLFLACAAVFVLSAVGLVDMGDGWLAGLAGLFLFLPLWWESRAHLRRRRPRWSMRTYRDFSKAMGDL